VLNANRAAAVIGGLVGIDLALGSALGCGRSATSIAVSVVAIPVSIVAAAVSTSIAAVATAVPIASPVTVASPIAVSAAVAATITTFGLGHLLGEYRGSTVNFHSVGKCRVDQGQHQAW